MKLFSALKTGAAALALAMVATSAHAINFHYLNGAGSSNPIAPITAAGHTPVGLNSLTAADLAGVSVLWVTNGSNSAPPAQVTSNANAIAAWVRGGGVLSYHDRYVDGGQFEMANLLPGAGGVNFVRSLGSAIDVINAAHPVVNGPAGVLGNASLDGGNQSNHGYATLGTLPVGATAVLNVGGFADRIVDFYYPFGAGWVYYSTIPLDFYLAGAGNNPPRDNIRNIYAVNEAAFQAGLVPGVVPEPTSLALLGLGLAGIGLARRRKA